MAHFRGTIKGQKGEASRLGSKKSGLKASLSGWDFGISVYLKFNEEINTDEIIVYLTKGSN